MKVVNKPDANISEMFQLMKHRGIVLLITRDSNNQPVVFGPSNMIDKTVSDILDILVRDGLILRIM